MKIRVNKEMVYNMVLEEVMIRRSYETKFERRLQCYIFSNNGIEKNQTSRGGYERNL